MTEEISFADRKLERTSKPPEILVSTKPLGEFNILGNGLRVGDEMFKGRIREEYLVLDAKVDINLNVDKHSQINFPRFGERDIGYLREYVVSNNVMEDMQTQFHSYDGNEFKYVCSRYIIKKIDDIYWGSLRKDFELMAVREGKIVYIDELPSNTDNVSDGQEQKNIDSRKAYAGTKFGELVTTSESMEKMNNEPEKPWTVDNTHYVLRHVAIVQHDENVVFNLAVAAGVRAFEEDGSAIEIHTKFGTLDDKFWQSGARTWWLNAKLSGANRTFYGLRGEDNHVTKVDFINTKDLLPSTDRRWKYDCNDSVRIIAKILDAVRRQLNKPGSRACIVKITTENKQAFVKAADVAKSFFE